jgi:hypothetical protein
MRRTIIIVPIFILIIIILVIGCQTNEYGFFIRYPLVGKHKTTFTQWNKEGINYYTSTKYDSLGFNQSGFNQLGFNNNGYDKLGFDENGFNARGFDKEGYNKKGFNTSGFNKNGYDKKGFNNKGFNKRGIHKITKTKYDNNGYDIYGNKNAFELKYFVDNFGDQTNDKYITQKIDGVFSNSATDNSPAYFHLIYTGNNELRFDVYEYNQDNKAHFSSYQTFECKFKAENGDRFSDYMKVNTSLKGSLSLDSRRSFHAVNMLKEVNEIKVYIVEVNGSTRYNFTIDCTGFTNGINYLK